MQRSDAPEWLNPLIAALQQAQAGLLQALHGLGLVPRVDGQPAWPWALRLSGENLLIDLGQARGLLWSLAALATAAALLVLALSIRRTRWPALGLAVLVLALAPWPRADLVLVPARPTSLHASPTGFSVESIARGSQAYARHCVACHGADGRGHGPLAARQSPWPPNFTSPLLWRRADGDLLWTILHDTRTVQSETGPQAHGQSGRLSSDDAWALIDFMKAQAAGQMLRIAGTWPYPVGLPDMDVRCAGQPLRRLQAWQSRQQRLRLVAGAAQVQEDPRLVSLQLRPDEPAGNAALDCTVTDPRAWQAMALISGSTRLEGMQWMGDRDGWLRALSRPGAAGWSEDDLVCRTDTVAWPATGPAADGLGALIARMDAEPVRFVKGGFVH
ncbi:Cytochrome c, mono- and diheme variants [Delftia tsuruhatensis]|uniref:c-type cytochrome n=1 Tax=Delftia tsuruhatensis TaxID=180282 RepID=UPI001E6D83AC|nr:cytochrome c [Delftia tsuruhatensis]CAB5663944.1 Cytochrome c, mono- and diheme variants [Delftia tsuruhatensis]CAC9677370.1 Cytochrome c, mono- and diheme variants [Delftia tsuruhatensis]